MADCKIIFLDVDGTITDYENNVPPSAVRAIRLARARGHRVYMCTGRSKAENPPEIWAIGFDGMIGGNGSYVEDAGQVVSTSSSHSTSASVSWTGCTAAALSSTSRATTACL